MLNKTLRITLVVFDVFLALTAILGGIALLAGFNSPPLAYLAGSPFRSYTIPGLSLSVLVGGTALIAAILTVRRHPHAALLSMAAGAMIIIFEIVEVMVIGLPPGAGKAMQIFYLALGVFIIASAIALWFVERRSTLIAAHTPAS